MNTCEGFLGLTVDSLGLREPVFVAPEAPVAEAARAMRAARATACLAGTPEAPAGILTERDVVRAVADGLDLGGPVSAVMTPRVVAVARDELVSEAFLAMIRHNIRRLAVISSDGRVTAMLDERDLLAARLESPVSLAWAISRAGDGEALARAYAGLSDILPRWLSQGADVAQAGALAAAVRDQLFARAAELAMDGHPASAHPADAPQQAAAGHVAFPGHDEGGPGLGHAAPGPATPHMALAALGSEGRREQFLATDQDNALILGEAEDEKAAGEFAIRLMAILAQAGLPPCPHGVTADNPAWRMTLPAWRERLDSLARDLGPDAVLSLSLLADIRHVSGDPDLTKGLRTALHEAVREHPRCLRYMAREAVRFEPPVSVFGALVTERAGPARGGLDIKRGGVFPLTQGARVLALDLGVERTETASRLHESARAGVITPETAADLTQALEFMQELRLRFQAAAIARGQEPDNILYPDAISRLERARLKECFRAVASFQSILTNKYQLHLLT